MVSLEATLLIEKCMCSVAHIILPHKVTPFSTMSSFKIYIGERVKKPVDIKNCFLLA